MLSFDIRLVNLMNANLTSATNSSELDLNQYLGNVFLNVDARAGGTGDSTVGVEHAETSGGTFSAVPASALFDPLSGAADTFANITTTAYEDTLGLNRQQLKRFVRVAIAGTVTSQDVAIVAAIQPQMTEES
jgi:hypothetical protein